MARTQHDGAIIKSSTINYLVPHIFSTPSTLSLCVCLSLSSRHSLSVCLSICLCLSVSLSPCLCLSVSVSLSLTVCLSVCLSLYGDRLCLHKKRCYFLDFIKHKSACTKRFEGRAAVNEVYDLWPARWSIVRLCRRPPDSG